MLIAATVVQFGVGWQYYVGAYKSLRAGGANMDVLIALGSSVAYFYSLAVTFGLIPSPYRLFRDRRRHHHPDHAGQIPGGARQRPNIRGAQSLDGAAAQDRPRAARRR